MNYEEADYQAEQQAYAEAEAQQQQEQEREMYLEALLSDGFYELWSMEVAIDLLIKNGQGAGDAVKVLIARKNELMTLLPKEQATNEITPPAYDSADNLIALLSNMFDVELDEHEEAENIRETIALNIQGFRANSKEK